ncbi:MAG TPA: hypothetical protein VEK34_14400 [Methylocella sp.]|nr:hypothetical protein [Methylocella sp.]
MVNNPNQLTLSFFETPSPYAGNLTLDAGYGNPQGLPSIQNPTEDEPDRADRAAPVIEAQNFRLTGDRQLARGWKARAADNFTALRLAFDIEQQKRNARLMNKQP